MKIRIYTIRDNKAEAYNQPFFERTDATAIRAVQAAATKDQNFIDYPEDYALYALGEFDDATGTIESQPPRHLANMLDLKNLEKQGEESRTAQIMGKDFPRAIPQGGE